MITVMEKNNVAGSHVEDADVLTRELTGGLRAPQDVLRVACVGETDATVRQRTQAALENGLTPIVCVGETLAEREANRTDEVLLTQFDGGISGLTAEQFAKSVIAYEPVWAIGTGKVATPEMAAAAHRTIRQRAASKFGPARSTQTVTWVYALEKDRTAVKVSSCFCQT